MIYLSEQFRRLNILLESFLLFSQSIPSQNLGFVDSKATLLELTIGDRDLAIHQSPAILSSNRGGGTTGAGKCCLIKACSIVAEIVSCLEDHTSLRLLDNLIKPAIQAQCPRRKFSRPRIGMRYIRNHRVVPISTHRLLRLNRPGICPEAAKSELSRESPRLLVVKERPEKLRETKERFCI